MIETSFNPNAKFILYHGNCTNLLSQIPDNTIKLIITSPPYNIGKAYEQKLDLDTYIQQQTNVIAEAVRILRSDGSLCWQTGNHINDGEVYPLDMLLYPIFKQAGIKLRNRIIWTFGHGLHCSKRFSGRYETILWFTKTDNYTFNLDPIRIPQKYPGKRHFKAEKKGELSGNPLGKNPSDVWDFPNVKNNHPEKTIHPCQFPIELVERLVLSMTDPGDIVLDPYAGVGSSLCAAALHNRRGWGADLVEEYLNVAKERLNAALNGTLRYRRMGTQLYQGDGKLTRLPEEFKRVREAF